MTAQTRSFKSQKSVAAERTPEALDFADRLHLLGKDAHVISWQLMEPRTLSLTAMPSCSPYENCRLRLTIFELTAELRSLDKRVPQIADTEHSACEIEIVTGAVL